MEKEVLGTHQKALNINLDPSKYGSFAEIGAGQEVGRWFFRVGAAAGTIAKTISAYDMTVSDSIYGTCDRFVSRQRLQTMLDHEYELLVERLDSKRGDKTKFFVYANTVAAKSWSRPNDEAHGWMGIRFQTEPRSKPSQIEIHVRLLEKENIQEQEALGAMGVNLIYGALYHHADVKAFLLSLMDSLNRDRVEVDMVKLSGPAFARLDNRLVALQLVQLNLTDAALFTAQGEVVPPAEVLYKKAVLVERGSFRPPTNLTVDMLQCAVAKFREEPLVKDQPIVELMEMTMRTLAGEGGTVDYQDFLARADILGAMGKTVLVSNYARFFRLASYLFRCTKKPVAIALGAPALREVFDEDSYGDLEGGILEAFGRLFKNDLKLYVYPMIDRASSQVVPGSKFQVAPNLKHLHTHLVENRLLVDLDQAQRGLLSVFTRQVLAKIQDGDPSWEDLVPPVVAQLIKDRKFFLHGATVPV